jgi:hypothetical protein
VSKLRQWNGTGTGSLVAQSFRYRVLTLSFSPKQRLCRDELLVFIYSIVFGLLDRQNCTENFTSSRATFPAREHALTRKRPNEAVTNGW